MIPQYERTSAICSTVGALHIGIRASTRASHRSPRIPTHPQYTMSVARETFLKYTLRAQPDSRWNRQLFAYHAAPRCGASVHRPIKSQNPPMTVLMTYSARRGTKRPEATSLAENPKSE